MHTEIGSKQAASAPNAHVNVKASGAYGSEMAYTDSVGGHHIGGHALKQLLINDQSAGEEGEEEYEEESTESEEELTDERKSTVPDFPIINSDDDNNSHATSYSDFYVIDEKEEQRLKQIAFEKFMADKAIEENKKSFR